MEGTKLFHLNFTQDELNYLLRDLHHILQVADKPQAYAHSPFIRFTEINGAIPAVSRLKEQLTDVSQGTTNFMVTLNASHCLALKETMNLLLLAFSQNPKKGVGETDNPFLAITLGKVYHAVSGEEHPHLQKEHFNAMIDYRIKAMMRNKSPQARIDQIKELLIP